MKIAVDTSVLIAFIEGDSGEDVDALRRLLPGGDLVLPPAVLTEALSEPELPPHIRATVLGLPKLEILEDYWVRAADSRARLLSRGLRARLPDALIAQSCIDHRVPLITRDRDFRHFAEHCGLTLA